MSPSSSTQESLECQAASLQYQANLLDLAHDAIIVLDMQCRITFWSMGAMQIYGWAREEATGRTCQELLRTRFPLSRQEILERVIDDEYWEGELLQNRKNGDIVTVSSRWALKRDEHGQPSAILEINSDITERKRAEDDSQKLHAELEQRVRDRTVQLEAANHELEAFCYAVSHDLRAPLRSMDGFTQALVEDYAANLGEQGLHWCLHIRAASQKMGQLIDDLLRLSRTTRGQLSVGPVDLQAQSRKESLTS